MLILTSEKQYGCIDNCIRKNINEYLNFVVKNATFYKANYSNKNARIENFYNLPLVQGDALAENPFTLVALKDQVVLMTSSSGTYGKQKIIFRTNEDLQKIMEMTRKTAECCGITCKDKIIMIQPFDLANLGLGALRTFQNIGALSCPAGLTTPPEYILWLLKEMRFNVIFSTPSKAVYLAELSKKGGINSNINVEKIVSAGEPILPVQREKLLEIWGSDIYGTYGSEEIDGISSECPYHDGYHVMDENLIIEVLNEETMKPAETNSGLMVVTKLNYTGTILLRYSLGDLVEINENPCRCGREEPRIKIKGRIKEKCLGDGVTDPSQFSVDIKTVELIAKSVLGYIPIYQLLVEEKYAKKTIILKIHCGKSEDLANKIMEKFVSYIKGSEKSFVDEKINIKIQLCPEISDFYFTHRGKMPKIVDKSVYSKR